MRSKIGWMVKSFFVASAIVVWGAFALTFIPAVEKWVAPPVKIELMNFAVNNETREMRFFMNGEKYRDCAIENLNASWIFADGAVLPVGLQRPEGSMIERPWPLFVAGDRFYRGPFSTTISDAVDPSARFRITYTFSCHPLWNLTVSVMKSYQEILDYIDNRTD